MRIPVAIYLQGPMQRFFSFGQAVIPNDKLTLWAQMGANLRRLLFNNFRPRLRKPPQHIDK